MEDWKRRVFEAFRLYVVTDLKGGEPGILEKVDRIYAAGADIIQLRSKRMTDAQLFGLGREIRRIASARRKLFFVNDRPDLALATEADGLHIGQDDLPVPVVRALFSAAGRECFLGKSTHSLEQAVKTSREAVDYIGVGPVFATPTKPHYGAVGTDLVQQVSQAVELPFVAIGGIDLNNLNKVLESGARRVAVVRAIMEAEDFDEATRCFRQSLDRHAQGSALHAG